MNKNQKIGIHNKGKKGQFIDNTVEGADIGMLDEGENTFAKENKFRSVEKYAKDVKDLPIWLKWGLAFVGILGFLLSLYIYFNPNGQTIINLSNSDVKETTATNTLNISELFSKALSLDTIVERQDFLNKYVGDQVYGEGKVKQISRLGNDNLIVDINVNGNTISCIQEENEKQLILLQNKVVSFYGIFTYKNIFEHGLEIDACVLQKKN